MTDWIIQLLSAAGVGSALTVLISKLFEKKKLAAEADEINATAMNTAIDGSVKWAEQMRKDIDDLRKLYTELLYKYQTVLDENHNLRKQIADLKAELRKYEKTHDPSFRPD